MFSLPVPTGPFIIGVTDIETENLLFRLFYPVRRAQNYNYSLKHHYDKNEKLAYDSAKPEALRKGEKTVYWLPSSQYGRGYGDFLQLPSIISVPISALLSRFYLPNAIMDAPIEIQNQKFPLVLFSHGLGGMIRIFFIIIVLLS